MKKLQGSRYEQNNEITVTPNDEKLIVTLKSLSYWPSKSQYILCILTTQQNSMNGGKNSKSQNTRKNIQAQLTEFLHNKHLMTSEQRNQPLKSTKYSKNSINGVKKYKDHDMTEMHTTQQLQMMKAWKLTVKPT